MVAENVSNGNGQKHRSNTAGLKPPWKPGQSGNPGGRPKGSTLMALVREVLESNDHKRKRKVAKGYANSMEKGSFQHLKEFIEREEGKVPDRIANADGSNIELAPLRLDGDREL